MLAGTFERKIKKLNPRLKIFCGNDNSKPAGLYYIFNGEYTQICGIDKNSIPEYPIYDESGHFVKSGWKRVLMILFKLKLIDKSKTENLFQTKNWYIPKYIANSYNNIFNDINNLKTKDDILSLAEKIERER